MESKQLGSDRIRQLQSDLGMLAVLDEQYLRPTVDGVYGPETTEAVRIFQRLNGLQATGEVDDMTLRRLEAECNSLQRLLAGPQPIFPFPSSDFVLSKGESGPLVYILQAMLNELCADFVAPAPPVMSGHYDDDTLRCVQHWQTVAGIPATGEVDRVFWDLLAELYNALLS